MAYTFAVDEAHLEDLKAELANAKIKIGSDIPQIFTNIGNMESEGHWSGSSYDSFKGGTDNYEKALNTLPDVIEVFEKEINIIKGEAGPLIHNISSEIQNMAQK